MNQSLHLIYRDLSIRRPFVVIFFHGDSMTFKNKSSGKCKQLRKNYRTYMPVPTVNVQN